MPDLQDIHPRAAHRWQQVALMRLQLRFTAETHRLYRHLFDELVGIVQSVTDADGMVDGATLMGSLGDVETRWAEAHGQWARLFRRARIEAASIPFGALLVWHNHYFRPFTERRRFTEQLSPQAMGTLIRLWEQRRQRMLDTAAERIYGDGFNLSWRIWRLEQGGLDTIRRTLATGMAERTSAAQLAQALEPMLGAGRNCPRWAYSRLYRQTPTDRAVSKEGLLSDGGDCQSRGMAYNALRLARNEMQIAHHMMNDELLQNAPWVEGEYVRLSPQHPKPDICDDYAGGGPYAPGEVTLPLHVSCMCYKEAAVLQTDAFRQQTQGWLAGENDFLDEYADYLGVDDPAQPLDWAMPIAQTLALWTELGADGHAAALGVE